MAIITDPDSLNREEVIFGSTSSVGNTAPQGFGIIKTISLAEVGPSKLDAGAPSNTGFYTAGDTVLQTSIDTANVAAGDIVAIFNGNDQGHYKVDSVDGSNVNITVAPETGQYQFSNFETTETDIIFEIYADDQSGVIADGVSEQAIYSYSKDQWKTDTGTTEISADYPDDLIRHPFPFEGITPTQFEIGGGSAHDNWDYHNLHTKNLIRNGGWRSVDKNGTTIKEYGGFISLGAMDSDAQPYYQLTSTTTPKADFAFTGTVNEAVEIYEEGGADNRGYFKAFLRKKGKTYASYDLLTEQNLTTLTYKDFSFPLTHSTDAAITASEGDILGISPYATVTQIAGANATSVTITDETTYYKFEKSGATWSTDGVAVDDVILITTGSGDNDGQYGQIIQVESETVLRVAKTLGGADDSAPIAADTFTAQNDDIEVYTKKLITGTDAKLGDVDGSTGTLTSATGGFTASGVVAGSMVRLTTAANTNQGVYKVVSNDSDTQLTLNTSDNTDGFTPDSPLDFEAVGASMHLQYKWEERLAANTDTSGFVISASAQTITADQSDFPAVSDGDIVTISGSVSNDGSYTILATGSSATVLKLIASDQSRLTNETTPATATVTINRGFARTIDGVVYGFRWRLFGNGGSLANCYQFTQHQLRQTTDIDWGPDNSLVGNITDSTLSFASPTGTSTNMYIDDLASADTNNITYIDATGQQRLEKFTAGFTINFNDNLLDDANTVFTVFFTNDDSPGSNLGRDYGTKDAIIVKDDGGSDITGSNPSGDLTFTFDFDNNVQRGNPPETDQQATVPITIVAIGLDTAQFVRLDTSISRAKSQTFSLVSALERNYST